ncbi:MAG TPA: glycosyltransferase family 1 protein [Candidatus Saccharimonadales bacterium]|nr:glycosyltransferase family 1 protein [Candidatus Saccharimonadales bacterium]
MALYKHRYSNDNLVKRKIKIVFDATPMVVNKTGVAYYIERLAVQLATQYPDEVKLVGFYYNFLGRRDASHLPRRANLSYTGASIIPSKIVFQLRRWGIEVPIEFLAMQKADFILYGNFLSHPSLFHTPSAPVIHDLTYLDLPAYVSPKLRRDLERFVPKAIQRSRFVVTVSEFSKQRIMSHYRVPAEDILVTLIPPVPPVRLSAERCRAILKENGITKPYILFVGTIEPRKNIIGLVEGYLQLPKKVRDEYQLVLAGRVERFASAEEARLHDALNQGQNVTHLGYISDEVKDALYQSAAMFAHASEYEGFGMPVLEAMSHGVPCALSDIPVFREVAGNSAVYFDYRKPEAIARAMQKILESPGRHAELSKLAKQRAGSFSWQKVATDLYETIRSSLHASS